MHVFLNYPNRSLQVHGAITELHTLFYSCNASSSVLRLRGGVHGSGSCCPQELLLCLLETDLQERVWRASSDRSMRSSRHGLLQSITPPLHLCKLAHCRLHNTFTQFNLATSSTSSAIRREVTCSIRELVASHRLDHTWPVQVRSTPMHPEGCAKTQ